MFALNSGFYDFVFLTELYTLKCKVKGKYTSTRTDSETHFVYRPPGELVSALACHPEYKLLSVCTVPQMPASSIAFSTFSWPALLKHLRQMLISNSKMEEGKFLFFSLHFSSIFLRQDLTGFDYWSGIDWQLSLPPAAGRVKGLARGSFNSSLANLLVLRGKDVFSAETGQSGGNTSDKTWV